ncbi:MAG: phosphoenolpyruvate--protein phosphotransferase [Spirochaeta sp. LUC14_002_19_P3]|nr:MAG: phosphoenolpyruvate--protein phosphotransferase [Spirochaeta sp. LUC14_002_19_P3]
MVGLVLVSHSRALAQAVQELAEQAAGEVKMAATGGIGEAGEEFGTDAVAIMEAIQQVDSKDGVLLLMDMGSALLSAETSLELLGEEIASRVRICSAPLVEGAVIAAVQASIGANLETVREEALKALIPKQEQIQDSVPPPKAAASAIRIPADALRRNFIIRNHHGLHARPAAALVRTVSQFGTEVFIQSAAGTPVSALSLNSVAKLNLRKGDTATVYAWGNRAEEFMDEMAWLVQSEFGERELSREQFEAQKTENNAPEAGNGESEPRLICVSRGTAIGSAWKMEPMSRPVFTDEKPDSPEVERLALKILLTDALDSLKREIENSRDREMQSVLQMHQVMIEDPDLLRRANMLIEQSHYSAERAWWEACRENADEYRAIEDNELLQARADDLIDIGIRVLRNSAKVTLPALSEAPAEAILFIDEISPGILASLDKRVKAVVTRTGGSISHAAIIARSAGLPMLSGFTDIENISPGVQVIVDARGGKLIINPSEAEAEAYKMRMREEVSLEKELKKQAAAEARTTDAVVVQCAANIGSGAEADTLAEYGAEGVGVFRSEFLFLHRQAPPSEEEQYEAYSRALRGTRHTVTIRLLDIGGDKSIPYLPMPKEENPFLGVRGIRFILKHPQLLSTQLRALSRAAVHGRLQVMIPMVVDANEIRQIRDKLAQITRELKAEKIPCANFPLGIMIETPASIFCAGQLAREADFFSIGTNDLSQYILAAERNSTALSELYDICHPAVLRSLQAVTSTAIAAGTPISICGEAAVDPEAIPLLLAFGIRKLSASPERLPAMKHLIRTLSVKNCKQFLTSVWTMENAGEIRAAVRERFRLEAGGWRL